MTVGRGQDAVLGRIESLPHFAGPASSERTSPPPHTFPAETAFGLDNVREDVRRIRALLLPKISFSTDQSSCRNS